MKSTAKENYLKTILELQENHDIDIVKLNLIAKELGHAAGTVTGMIKTLAAEDLVEYRAYVGCRLTVQGRVLAVKILRNHRIIELFLVEIIGLDWADVHDEAEHIEHVISSKVLSGIDKLLGYPTFDPHGDPIPSIDGVIIKSEYQKLSHCSAGDSCEITRVLDESKPFLNFISEMTLFPGTKILINDIESQAGIIKLKPDGSDVVVMSLDSAEKLLIRSL